MMRGSWIWLVEIEGLGRSGLTANNQRSAMPMALTSEPWPGDSAFAGGATGRVCDEWQPVLQPESVRLSEQSFSPFANKPGAQTLSFDLALPDALPEIEAFFLSVPEPVATLTAAIAPTDTTINMTSTSAITAGDVIYIGAECFRVRTVNSATQVTVVDRFPTSLIWPAAKSGNASDRPSDGAVGLIGAIGSRIAQHDIPAPNEPPPWPDDRVYTQNTRVKGRRVYLRRVSWGLDETGAEGYREQLIGQYLITNVTVNADGTTASVSATSLVAMFEKAELGAMGVADRILVARSDSGNPANGGAFAYAFIDKDPSPDAESRRIWKGSGVAYSNGSEAGLFVGMDNVNVLGRKVGVATSLTLGVKFFANDQNASADLVAQFDAESVGTAVKEVLLSDPFVENFDTTGNLALFGAPASPYYSLDKPGGAGVLTHPLHMLLAHLGQLDSNLPHHWQLRLDAEAVATSDILQLAELFATGGWPGVCATGPQKAMEWMADTFIRPLGCGWAVDEYGRLTVASIISPRQSPWSVASIWAGVNVVREVDVSVLQPGRQVQRIVEAEAWVTQANIGQGLGKSPRLTIQSADAYRVADGDPESSTFILNAMGAMSPDNPITGAAAFQLTPVSLIRSITSTVGTYLRGGAIQYTLRIPSSFPDEDEAYDPNGDVLGPAMPSRYAVPGSTLQLASIIPGLRKLPGQRLAVVLGHQWQDNCTTQQLRVLDLGGTVRIAAAGRVVSASVVSGSLEIVLEPDFEVTPTPYSAPPFGDITEDGETLSAFASATPDAEYVRFFFPNLAERNPGPGNEERVVSYNAATNTLTTTAAGGYTPVAGDFVLFANQGESDVDEYFTFFGRDRFTI
jgi:hypothetical protein